MMNNLKDTVDRNAFGVCSYLGDKMGVASARVRIYFIYISFVTLGSPILLYLFAAFWLNVKDYIREHQSIFRQTYLPFLISTFLYQLLWFFGDFYENHQRTIFIFRSSYSKKKDLAVDDKVLKKPNSTHNSLKIREVF